MNRSDENRRLWRSIDELENTAEFREALEREFPSGASEWDDRASRRRFLQLMGASISLAGLTGCTRQPVETIMPYVDPPEQAIPGRPLYFATAMLTNGLAQGVIVESHLGRPTKIEGNPDHPASLGATDVTAQASVLGLYDPDRSKSVRGPDGIVTWSEFELMLRKIVSQQRAKGGTGFRILTETVTSPTLGAQMNQVRQALPGTRWFQYDPTGPHSARAAAQMSFGRPVNHIYRLDAAKVVLALDSDFLACGTLNTRYAHDFAQGRRVRGGRSEMTRLYAAETAMTSTGGKADHRWALSPAAIEAFASELGQRMQVAGVMAAGASGVPAGEVDALAQDLLANRGAAVVVAGDECSTRVHSIVHAINAAIGAPVVYTAPVEVEPADQIGSIRELTGEMNAGKVETLLIIGGNPVWNAPADLDFARALSKVPNRIRLGLYDDETSAVCGWHLPMTHSLEAWSDARAFDGTVTLLQPLIAPLYDARSDHELLSLVLEAPARGYDIVRAHWSAQKPAADFESWWSKSIHDGVVAGTALSPITAAPQGAIPGAGKINAPGFAVSFRPDPYIGDGRFANNGWAQELPRPMTKLAWDNTVLISPRTAARLDVKTEDVVELKYEGRSVKGPVWVLPGHADECATVYLGYGRMRAGRVAAGAGFNAYPLRTSGALSFAPNAEIRKTGDKYHLASTQMHQSMEGREPVISAALAELQNEPDLVRRIAKEPPKGLTLYPQWGYTGAAWGMTIDLTACVNCSACVIACQAENNIPVVGKEQIRMGRQMHWIRVDNYFEGPREAPSAHFQPVPCMQCENAPCELVCPTQATNHSADGLNDMVYNRCVGTRYCSNNCPYKVRRFNFFLYQDWTTPSLKLQRNPDVTVRSRGVMEKCTYCVQRIRRTEIQARQEDRYIRDGEIQTACMQVCPTQAIVFGNINDRESAVAKLKADNLNYSLLAELNTRPRTTYLAEVRNPNPGMNGRKS
jgi:molybdopterin-containing oxidoreductase family iron-sulfur binding subunit